MHLYSTRRNEEKRAFSSNLSSGDVSGISKTLKNPSYKIEVTPKCEQEESDEEENYDDLFGGRAAAAPPFAPAPTGSAPNLDVKPSMPLPSGISNPTLRRNRSVTYMRNGKGSEGFQGVFIVLMYDGQMDRRTKLSN